MVERRVQPVNHVWPVLWIVVYANVLILLSDKMRCSIVLVSGGISGFKLRKLPPSDIVADILLFPQNLLDERIHLAILSTDEFYQIPYIIHVLLSTNVEL